MSEYEVLDDYSEVVEEPNEHFDNCDAEIDRIQDEYRRKKLMESLIGPFLSTAFHVVLIIILAIILKGTTFEEKVEIEVELLEEEEIILEEEIEEPQEIEESDVNTPVVAEVETLEVDTKDTALEDVNDDAPSTDDNSDIDMVSEILVSPSAFASANVMGGRGASGRAGSLSKFGGSAKGQQKLKKAMMWLASVQSPDGSWGNKQGLSGLALLTFLAHGETHLSKEYGPTVQKAIKWLVEARISTGAQHGYPHAIRTYALAEAYTMTGISIIEEPLLKCIDRVVKGQQEGGSFEYNYKNKSTRQDLSFAGWNYQAMKAAYGTGLEIPGLEEGIYKAIAWLKKFGGSKHSFPYASKNNVPAGSTRATMRAVGVLCLQLFNEGAADEIKDEIKIIAKDDLVKMDWNKPPGKHALYGWYYATQCMFQAGGEYWKSWNRKFQKVLTDNQHPDGYWTKPNDGGVAHLNTKIYATTLCALQLTVFYRYLPSGRGAQGFAEVVKKHKDAARQKHRQVELDEHDEEAINLLD